MNLKAKEFDFHMLDLAYRYPAISVGPSRLGKPLVRERHRQHMPYAQQHYFFLITVTMWILPLLVRDRIPMLIRTLD